METGWVVSIVLGVVIVVLVVVVVVWVMLRRQGRKEEQFRPADSSETVAEHEAHSVSAHVNKRWDALLKSWEEEHEYNAA